MQNYRQPTRAGKRRVVDAFTRTLHALMAISFGVAYLSSEVEGLRLLHVTMGYTLGTVFLLRVAWGLLGPRRVHLVSLWRRLPDPGHLRALIRRHEWQDMLRHVLTLSIVVLLLSALPVTASGYLTYFHVMGQWTEEVHETAANLMLVAALGHAGTVAILKLGAPGPQLRPMITGLMSGPGPDLVKHNLAAVSLALMALVAGFWVWQTWQYVVDPHLMAQPGWLHPAGGYKENDDD